MAPRTRDSAIDDAILRAAAACLAELGYQHFSVENVADRVGVPKSTVYKRWNSRQELLHAVIAGWLQAMTAQVPSGRINPTLRDDLLTAVHAVADLASTRQGRAAAQAALAAHDDESAHDSPVPAATTELWERIRAIFMTGSSEGLLPESVDTDAATDLLLGAVWARVLTGRQLDSSDIEQIVDLTLAAVR